MGVFSLTAALRSLGMGQSPIDALGLAYGTPECLLSLTKNALSVIPSPILNSVAQSLQEGRESASERVAALKKKILMENGIFELDTENGTFRFVSDSSKNKLDKNSANKSASILDFINAVGAAAQTGAQLYTNYTDAVTTLTGVIDCVESYGRFLSYHKGPANKYFTPEELNAKYALEIQEAREAETFIEDAGQVLSDISNIISQRIVNPDLEPEFNDDFTPSSVNQTSSTLEALPIFRLVFGPPKSKVGQFLLSVDGLYYDSQSGGLPSVSGVIIPEERYKFNFPANLGGKGQVITSKDLDTYVDTIFDLNTVDDSLDIQRHYDTDHFLQVLIGQKNRNLYNLSAQLIDLYRQGYIEDSAMVVNMKQQIYSVVAQHNIKINKRKKQIEIAVKAPTVFGGNKVFNFGEIPINDFSYLSQLNLAVAFERQNKLIFRQGEVSGVVLPIQPKFVKASEAEVIPNFSHLIVPPVGTGSILFENSGTNQSNVLSLTDSIITDKLIAVYNFLETNIEKPGSQNYSLLNCASKTNKDKAAQLVGNSITELFPSGLAIPHLRGMVRLSEQTGAISGLGSYMQLPNAKEFQDLLYNPDGMTFQTWTYIPNLTASTTNLDSSSRWTPSSFHRLLLACENIGGADNLESVNNLQLDYGSECVRGLVCGFTCDRQIVSDSYVSDTSSLNPPVASGIHFYIAPTRSFNASDIGFLRDTVTIDCASPTYRSLKASIPITSSVGGKNFGMVSGQFCQITVTIEPKTNELKMYLDDQLMVTSALSNVFGITPFTTVKIPSFVKTNSFSYAASNTLGVFADGPTVSSFTPWIIGGGFSDGLPLGFMGANSGKISGLNGYVGSVKFYSKPLTLEEVLYNYDRQKGMFKNILL